MAAYGEIRVSRAEALAYVRRVQRVFERRPSVWLRARPWTNCPGRFCAIGGAVALLLHERGEWRRNSRGCPQVALGAIGESLVGDDVKRIVYANDHAASGIDAAHRLDRFLTREGA